MEQTYESVVARFVAKIQPAENGCYEWTGTKLPSGYGRFVFKGKFILAHRVSYILFVDPDLSDNLVIHHKCENRGCVNPKHLEKMGKKAHWKAHFRKRRGWDGRT